MQHQSQLSKLFKKKKNQPLTNGTKDKYLNEGLIESTQANNITNNPVTDSNQSQRNAKRSSSRLSESFEVPESKISQKRAKIEASPKKKEKKVTPKKVKFKGLKDDLEADEKKKQKKVENCSKSSMKTAVSESDDNEISSKTKGIIEGILNKKSEVKLAKNIEEVNYLNVNNFLRTPAKLPNFNNNLSVSNSAVTDNKKSEAAEGKLSSRTLEIMESLKKERHERINRFQRESVKERARSDSSFSLRFKYEDLLKEDRELIIPPHYKALVNMQNYLDNTINAFKLRKDRIPFIEEIKTSIELNYKQ
jgi:hypothetical protein